MLINTYMNRIVFDPNAYKGKLAIVVYTDDKKECGVFSGMHNGFVLDSEMNMRQPVVNDEKWSGAGLEVFLIERKSCAPKNQTRTYNYVVSRWVDGVYANYQSSEELSLIEISNDCDDESGWHINFRGVCVIMSDYGK